LLVFILGTAYLVYVLDVASALAALHALHDTALTVEVLLTVNGVLYVVEEHVGADQLVVYFIVQ